MHPASDQDGRSNPTGDQWLARTGSILIGFERRL
jgi:hypothetical protein